MAISIRVNGIDAANHSIVSLTPTMASTVLKQMSQIAFDQMQDGAKTHNKSGNLFASVYNRSTGQMRREVGHDPQRAPHAIFVVFGTKPHVIRPKGATLETQRELFGKNGTQRSLTADGKLKPMPGGRKLVLRWAAGGKFIFSQWVNHPGYQGDNYMQRAADEAVRQFDAIVNQAFKEAS